MLARKILGVTVTAFAAISLTACGHDKNEDTPPVVQAEAPAILDESKAAEADLNAAGCEVQTGQLASRDRQDLIKTVTVKCGDGGVNDLAREKAAVGIYLNKMSDLKKSVPLGTDASGQSRLRA